MTTQTRLRALVVYESMFGCTEKVAVAVADGIRRAGLDVELRNVRSAPAPDDARFDLLVVGAPTHAFSLSRPSTRADAVRQGAPPAAAATGLREWLDSVGTGGHRLAAAFDTRVTQVRRIPKAASTRAAHVLTRHGYELVARPAAFLVEEMTGPLVDGELARATAWGERVALAAVLQGAVTA